MSCEAFRKKPSPSSKYQSSKQFPSSKRPHLNQGSLFLSKDCHLKKLPHPKGDTDIEEDISSCKEVNALDVVLSYLNDFADILSKADIQTPKKLKESFLESLKDIPSSQENSSEFNKFICNIILFVVYNFYNLSDKCFNRFNCPDINKTFEELKNFFILENNNLQELISAIKGKIIVARFYILFICLIYSAPQYSNSKNTIFKDTDLKSMSFSRELTSKTNSSRSEFFIFSIDKENKEKFLERLENTLVEIFSEEENVDFILYCLRSSLVDKQIIITSFIEISSKKLAQVKCEKVSPTQKAFYKGVLKIVEEFIIKDEYLIDSEAFCTRLIKILPPLCQTEGSKVYLIYAFFFIKDKKNVNWHDYINNTSEASKHIKSYLTFLSSEIKLLVTAKSYKEIKEGLSFLFFEIDKLKRFFERYNKMPKLSGDFYFLRTDIFEELNNYLKKLGNMDFIYKFRMKLEQLIDLLESVCIVKILKNSTGKDY